MGLRAVSLKFFNWILTSAGNKLVVQDARSSPVWTRIAPGRCPTACHLSLPFSFTWNTNYICIIHTIKCSACTVSCYFPRGIRRRTRRKNLIVVIFSLFSTDTYCRNQTTCLVNSQVLCAMFKTKAFRHSRHYQLLKF